MEAIVIAEAKVSNKDTSRLLNNNIASIGITENGM
jgi:hypothetical protein